VLWSSFKKRWAWGAALALALAACVLGLYGWRWQQFRSNWNVLRPGMTAEAVKSLLGTPSDDRKLINILGERTTKLSWEYAWGPYVYEVQLEYDERQRQLGVVYDSFRRCKEGREWISLKAR
jgi:hypothetical protein